MIAFFRRGLIAVLALSVLTLSPTTGAPPVAQSTENARYAAIVVDAATGEVLFERYADNRRYPASVTKMMTLYMTFEALSEGRAKLDDVITVSPRAASQPPSKLGLAAGQTITLDDAMHATAVRSANDMAVAIAEHIGGSEARFTALMTLKAEELGMTRTRYVNANGLPDSRQLTSARDLSILARAVMRDYPQYYRYFGFHDWSYQGREYRNTNGLLATGQGYDGMKTGYTNASGYNLAASAVRDGKRLITIVLGGRSTASRNAHVAELMDTGFELETLRDRGQPIQLAQAFFEQRGFGVSADNSTAVVYAANDDDNEDGATAVAYTAAAAPTPPPALAARMAEPVVQAELSPSPDLTATLNGVRPGHAAAATPRPAPSRPAAHPPAPPPAGRWAVQVGAFRDETVARDWLIEVNRRFRSQFTSAERSVQTAAGWYRSRFTGLTEDGAQAACAALAERHVTCMVVRPD
ncbi:MAG: D-alanyl-D-alanine carboxypeptidase family protein [Brevundimonas sp.]|jgi:D-alanyl-D-alanine carboxypeptidase